MRPRPEARPRRLQRGRAAIVAASAALALAGTAGAAGAARLDAGVESRVAGGAFELVVQAREGDGWWSLAERAAGAGSRWPALKAAAGGGEVVAGRRYVVPASLWTPPVAARVVQSIFPADAPHEGGWRHVVTPGRALGRAESAWAIAQAFCGDGRKHAGLKVPAGASRRGLRPGEVVIVPRASLLAHLAPPTGAVPPRVAASAPGPRPAPPPPARAETPPAPAATAPVDAETDADEDAEPAVVAVATSFAVQPGSRSDDGALTYASDSQGPHAIYRLRAGETLYTHVVLRFTGLLGGKEVNAAARRLAQRSGIQDVTDIAVGQAVRIPLDDLNPQHLPAGHPRRVAWEQQRREADSLAELASQRRNLEGVHVVLDVGHGGNDPGAGDSRTWEDDYAYDVACRFQRALAERTHATVHPLVRDQSTGHAPLSRIRPDADEVLLTTPATPLDGLLRTKTAVNLRWATANDILRKLERQGVPDDAVVFISLHADSLHESARGTMAYYPSAQLRLSSCAVPADVAACRVAEAGPHSAFAMTSREKLRSEGLSRRLAESLVDSVRKAGLAVHGFQPVRGSIVRSRPLIPAVLKYNRIPTAVLVETCNLNNREDQRQLRDPAFRQRLAEALSDGLVASFEKESRAPRQAQR